jgi:glycine amidinotransferase
MSSPVKSYTSWQPLEEVIVGRVYPPDYFDFVEDPQVRDQMRQILQESQEDLDNLQRTIEQYGARVVRPDIMPRDEFMNLQQDTDVAPLPPLTPRDWQITMGEKLLRVLHLPELNAICDDYARRAPGCIVDPHGVIYNPNHVMTHAVASCIVRVGTDVFFDNSDWMNTAQMEWIRDNVLDHRYRVHRAVTDGHGDAVFAILKPGVIISSMHDQHLNYQQDFPGWQVLKINDASITAAQQVGKFRYESLDGRWYLPGEKPSAQFAAFVDSYLRDWTGFVKETVFDVNCLVLDEQHVIFSGYNSSVFDYCKQHHIEPIVCELRHKYFWDGGISCCTQDIRRRGPLETYI